MTGCTARKTNPVESYCDGKVRFDTYLLAEAVAKRSQRRGRRGREVYRCPNCNGFHLGRKFRHVALQRAKEEAANE